METQPRVMFASGMTMKELAKLLDTDETALRTMMKTSTVVVISTKPVDQEVIGEAILFEKVKM